MNNENYLKTLIMNSDFPIDIKLELIKYLEEIIEKAWQYDSLD